MDNYDESEWERIATIKEIERRVEVEETDRLNKLLNLPFHLRIQERGQEEYLKGFEERQKEVFLNHSAKKWNIEKGEELELFQEFFTEFLRGEVKSIYEFLTKRGYKIINRKV